MATRPRTHHPALYQDWGNIILAAEDTIFRVHSGLLKSKSDLFKTVLQLPPPEGDVEGTSDENPIVLHHPAAHIALLLNCVINRTVELDLKDKLVVLELASFLLMDDIRSWILQEIKWSEPSPSPIQRVAYGVRCQLPDWISAGFYELIEFPGTRLSKLVGDEAYILSFDIYKLLVDAVQNIYCIRLFIASTVGTYKASTVCLTPQQCKALWQVHVYTPFAQRYLHPEQAMKASKAAHWVDECKIPNICPNCKFANKGRLVDPDMWFLEELTMIKAEDTLQGMMASFPVPVSGKDAVMATD